MQVKIPFYNILNMFLTGLVFLGGIILLFPQYMLCMIHSDIITNIGTVSEIIVVVCVFAIAYEIGLIINRLGSVIIEPICKRFGWISFDDDYIKFNQKKKEYPIMDTLSREYALSRTRIALFLTLAIIALCICSILLGFIFIVTVIIYFISYRKHAKKIVTLMQSDTDVAEATGGE